MANIDYLLLIGAARLVSITNRIQIGILCRTDINGNTRTAIELARHTIILDSIFGCYGI